MCNSCLLLSSVIACYAPMTPLFARRREIELRCIHVLARHFFSKALFIFDKRFGNRRYNSPAPKLNFNSPAKTRHIVSHLLQCPRRFTAKVFSAFGFSHDRTFLALGILRRRTSLSSAFRTTGLSLPSAFRAEGLLCLRLFARQDFPCSRPEAPYIILFRVKANSPKVVFLTKSL